MRTTLAISDDVLLAAKAIARKEGKTLGDVVSELARRSLKNRRKLGRHAMAFPSYRLEPRRPP